MGPVRRVFGIFAIVAGLATGAFLLGPLAAAEEGDEQAAGGVPHHEGKHEVSAAVGQAGGRFSLVSGFSMLLPPGMPIGHSRVLTLRVAKSRAKSKEVADGFIPIGPTVNFDGTLDATRTPIVVTYTAKRFSARKGHRIVLALEHGGFCDSPGAGRKLAGGLCGHFRLVDASYERGQGVVTASLEHTGGMRMIFGSVPVAPDPEPAEPAAPATP